MARPPDAPRARSVVISSPPGGRLGQYFRGVATTLAEGGHEVRLLIPADATSVPAVAGVAVERWPAGPAPSALRALTGRLRAWAPDLAVGSFAGDLMLLQASALARVPSRAVFHHTPRRQVEIDLGGLDVGARLRLRRRGLVYRLATDVLCATDRVRRDLHAMGVPDRRITRTAYAIPDPPR